MTVRTTRRFEGNAADVNRSKERAANKRHARQIVNNAEDDETPEELAFKEEQQRLSEESETLKYEAEDSSTLDWPELPEHYFDRLRQKPGVWDDEDDVGGP